MTRQLQPWFENVGKRQVRSPKVYIRDTGVLHALLGLRTFAALEGHPKLGASWEGFALEQAILAAGERNAYYWATQGSAELDLLLNIQGRRYGIEIKYSDAPKLGKSMAIAMSDLRLSRLYVVYPGAKRYALSKNVEALPLNALLSEIDTLKKSKRGVR